jgi:hypothetical protein
MAVAEDFVGGAEDLKFFEKLGLLGAVAVTIGMKNLCQSSKRLFNLISRGRGRDF